MQRRGVDVESIVPRDQRGVKVEAPRRIGLARGHDGASHPCGVQGPQRQRGHTDRICEPGDALNPPALHGWGRVAAGAQQPATEARRAPPGTHAW